VTGGRSYKHRSKDQVIEIDWSWLKCRPVVKGRFDERLRDKENVSEHFVVLRGIIFPDNPTGLNGQLGEKSKWKVVASTLS